MRIEDLIEDLNQEIRVCNKCKLAETRTNALWGEGYAIGCKSPALRHRRKIVLNPAKAGLRLRRFDSSSLRRTFSHDLVTKLFLQEALYNPNAT